MFGAHVTTNNHKRQRRQRGFIQLIETLHVPVPEWA